MNPYWRTQLPRLGQGVPHVFAEMQRYMRANKTYVLAIDDVRECFPSARLDDVMPATTKEYPSQTFSGSLKESFGAMMAPIT